MQIYCDGYRRSVSCANYKPKLEISVEVWAGGFENAKSLQDLGDCSGGGTHFLPDGVYTEYSASAVRGREGSKSNCSSRSTSRHFWNLGASQRATRWNPALRRKGHAERREAGASTAVYSVRTGNLQVT